MKAWATSLDITPSVPVTLAASGTPLRQATAVAEPLEATIVALHQDGGREPVVLVGVDLLYAGRQLRAAVERALPQVPAANIVLAASHTHRGPMTDDTKVGLGKLDDDYVEGLVQHLHTQLSDISERPWRQVELAARETVCALGVNRRRFRRVVLQRHPRFNEMTQTPNPGGPTDDTLSVLVGRDASGAPSFVVWSYACHPVAHPRRDAVSAHFPHVVRSTLRELYGNPGLPVLFLQGFSGDVRPSASAPGRLKGLRARLEGPRFLDMSSTGYDEWTRALGAVAVGAVEAARPVHGGVTTRRTEHPTSRFVSGATEPTVSFQSVRLGGLCIVGASAEVVSEYAAPVRAMAGSEVTMTVGCLDHPFGYAPTAAMLDEGGYEAGGFCRAFGLRAVAPNVEGAMMAGFASVL